MPEHLQPKIRARHHSEDDFTLGTPEREDTDAYIRTVSELSGVPENGWITATNRDVMIPIVAAMSRVENGVDACMTDVMAGWDLFING